MNYKLSELKEDIVIKSETAAEWATCIKILIVSGLNCIRPEDETFESNPYIAIMGRVYAIIDQTGITSDDTIVPASVFIAHNTPNPEPHSMNVL